MTIVYSSERYAAMFGDEHGHRLSTQRPASATGKSGLLRCICAGCRRYHPQCISMYSWVAAGSSGREAFPERM